MPDFVVLFFVFAFGACVGSFLNVVVFRLPRGQSLVSPPSRCPKCEHKLAWYDNLPVVGWMFLRGKCRYCRERISARYPIIEAITGALFVLYFVCYFDLQIGPCPPSGTATYSMVMEDGTIMTTRSRPMTFARDWPIYCLHMFLIATLLAVSLIDYELYIIPPEATWLMAGVGVVVHAIIASPSMPGTVAVGALGAATAAGSLIGWLVSLALLRAKIFKISFAEGEPMVDVDPPPGVAAPPTYTKSALRKELLHEVLFIAPALVLGLSMFVLTLAFGTLNDMWKSIASHGWAAGAFGSVLGAMVGAFLVWITRIIGSFAFGRLAMGLGDVHLMFGVGAILGAGAVTIAFFLAPFGGMALALYLIFFGKRREIPYGPYLGLGSAATLLFYCPIADWLRPGLLGLGQAVREMFGT